MIPWLLALTGLAGAALAACGLPLAAFVVWTPANVGQLALALRRRDRAQAALWLGYIAACIVGILQWS